MARRVHARASLSLLKKRFGGQNVRGNGWYGFAPGADPTQAAAIQERFGLVHRTVEELIRVDLEVSATLRGKLFVVHVDDPSVVAATTNLLLAAEGRTEAEVWGRYIPRVKALVISGRPNSSMFIESAAHETCHGICECLFGAVGWIPWGSEGYAEFIGARVLNSFFPNSPRDAHVATFRSFVKAEMDLSLRRILLFEDQAQDIPAHYLGCFQAHAALFIRFLDHLGAADTRIHNVFCNVVREAPPSCRPHILALERAFEKPIEEIDKDFHEFCAKL